MTFSIISYAVETAASSVGAIPVAARTLPPEETSVPLANINEADDDDWDEEWELQALREQQEQIARDCRLLA